MIYAFGSLVMGLAVPDAGGELRLDWLAMPKKGAGICCLARRSEFDCLWRYAVRSSATWTRSEDLACPGRNKPPNCAEWFA